MYKAKACLPTLIRCVTPLSTVESAELDSADARYRQNFAQLFRCTTGRLRQPQLRVKGPIRDFANVTLEANESTIPDPVPLIIIDDTWNETDVQQWRLQTGRVFDEASQRETHYLYCPSQPQHQLQAQQAQDRREAKRTGHFSNLGGPSSSSDHVSRHSRHSEDRIALQMAIGESMHDDHIVTTKPCDEGAAEDLG